MKVEYTQKNMNASLEIKAQGYIISKSIFFLPFTSLITQNMQLHILKKNYEYNGRGFFDDLFKEGIVDKTYTDVSKTFH